MASRNTHPFGKPTGLSPADLQRHAEPAAYLTGTVGQWTVTGTITGPSTHAGVAKATASFRVSQ
jgi:hypothetical protein